MPPWRAPIRTRQKQTARAPLCSTGTRPTLRRVTLHELVRVAVPVSQPSLGTGWSDGRADQPRIDFRVAVRYRRRWRRRQATSSANTGTTIASGAHVGALCNSCRDRRADFSRLRSCCSITNPLTGCDAFAAPAAGTDSLAAAARSAVVAAAGTVSPIERSIAFWNASSAGTGTPAALPCSSTYFINRGLPAVNSAPLDPCAFTLATNSLSRVFFVPASAFQ